MSAAELRGAYNAGQAAFARGEGPADNPYQPERVHPLVEADPHQTTLAALWLRGWQAASDRKAADR